MTLHRDDARRGRRRRASASGGSDGRRAPLGFAARAPRAPASIIRSRSPRRFGSAWSSPGRSRGRGPTSSARSRRRRSRAATRMPPTTLCRARTARGGSRGTRARSPRAGARRGGRPRGARGRPRGMARGASPRTRGWICIPAAAPRAIGPSRVRRGARRAFGRRRRAKGRLPPGPGLSSGGGSPRILRERDARPAETTTGFPAVVVVAASFPHPPSSGGASERRVPFRV